MVAAAETPDRSDVSKNNNVPTITKRLFIRTPRLGTSYSNRAYRQLGRPLKLVSNQQHLAGLPARRLGHSPVQQHDYADAQLITYHTMQPMSRWQLWFTAGIVRF